MTSQTYIQTYDVTNLEFLCVSWDRNTEVGHGLGQEVTYGSTFGPAVHVDDDDMTPLADELSRAQCQEDRFTRPRGSAQIPALAWLGQDFLLHQNIATIYKTSRRQQQYIATKLRYVVRYSPSEQR